MQKRLITEDEVRNAIQEYAPLPWGALRVIGCIAAAVGVAVILTYARDHFGLMILAALLALGIFVLWPKDYFKKNHGDYSIGILQNPKNPKEIEWYLLSWSSILRDPERALFHEIMVPLSNDSTGKIRSKDGALQRWCIRKIHPTTLQLLIVDLRIFGINCTPDASQVWLDAEDAFELITLVSHVGINELLHDALQQGKPKNPVSSKNAVLAFDPSKRRR